MCRLLPAFLMWTLTAVPLAAAGEPDSPKVLDPSYKHASPEAYERWRDLKYGLRIHWGIYSQYGFEASWPVMQMSHEKKQEYFDLLQAVQSHRVRRREVDGPVRAVRAEVLHHHHQAPRRLLDVRHQDPGEAARQLGGARRAEDRGVRPGLQHHGDAAAARHRQGTVRRRPPPRHRHRPLLLAHRLVRRRFPLGPVESVPRQELHARKATPRPTPASPRGTASRSARSSRNYGKVDMVCLDMELPEFCWPEIKQTVLMARRLQPDVLFRDRGIGAYGDYTRRRTGFPRARADRQASRPAVDGDLHARPASSPTTRTAAGTSRASWILSNLIDIVAKGGNFMVSIGPDAKGNFHPEAVEQLEYVGDWLKVNGEAIYAHPALEALREGDRIRYTRSKDGKHVYAISLNWPGERLVLRRSGRARARRSRCSVSPSRWPGSRRSTGLVIELPGHSSRSPPVPAARRTCSRSKATRSIRCRRTPISPRGP